MSTLVCSATAAQALHSWSTLPPTGTAPGPYRSRSRTPRGTTFTRRVRHDCVWTWIPAGITLDVPGIHAWKPKVSTPDATNRAATAKVKDVSLETTACSTLLFSTVLFFGSLQKLPNLWGPPQYPGDVPRDPNNACPDLGHRHPFCGCPPRQHAFEFPWTCQGRRNHELRQVHLQRFSWNGQPHDLAWTLSTLIPRPWDQLHG